MTDGELEHRLRRYGVAIDDAVRGEDSRAATPTDSTRARYGLQPLPGLTKPGHAVRERSARTRGAVVAAACLVFLALAVLLVRQGSQTDRASGGAGVVVVALDYVPEGVSLRSLDGHPAFLAREGHDLTAFVVDVRHLSGEPLWWCPNEGIFAGPFHGEMFDRQGRRIDGPGVGGLNRYLVRLDGRRAFIDTNDVALGGAERSGTSPAQIIEGNGPWDSGPGSFCDGAIKAEP